MTPLVAIIIGVALAAVVLVMINRSRRSNDGVDSFRRQIDALSPEARRPVIDQVHNAAGRNDDTAVTEHDPDDHQHDHQPVDDDPDDGTGGLRGA